MKIYISKEAQKIRKDPFFRDPFTGRLRAIKKEGGQNDRENGDKMVKNEYFVDREEKAENWKGHRCELKSELCSEETGWRRVKSNGKFVCGWRCGTHSKQVMNKLETLRRERK